MELLLYESSKVVAKIQVEVRKIDPENYDRNYEKLNAKRARGKKWDREAKNGRGKKWEKVKAHKNLILLKNKNYRTSTEKFQG